MRLKKEIKNYILALLFLSIGGWLLHLRAHPISGNPANFIPFIFGLLNITIVPFLFNYKRTAIIAYLFNGIGVIIGIIVMVTFSLSALPNPLTVENIILKTTLANIIILFPKLFIGQMILSFYYPAGLGRMFTTGWWVRHSCYLAIVFILGHSLRS